MSAVWNSHKTGSVSLRQQDVSRNCASKHTFSFSAKNDRPISRYLLSVWTPIFAIVLEAQCEQFPRQRVNDNFILSCRLSRMISRDLRLITHAAVGEDREGEREGNKPNQLRGVNNYPRFHRRRQSEIQTLNRRKETNYWIRLSLTCFTIGIVVSANQGHS
jgi:hypothetical protein